MIIVPVVGIIRGRYDMASPVVSRMKSIDCLGMVVLGSVVV